jgi:hypothetical protein
MVTFSHTVKKQALQRANYHCECGCQHCTGNKQLTPHHRVPNTVANRRRFGSYLQSVENCMILCQFCHANCLPYLL